MMDRRPRDDRPSETKTRHVEERIRPKCGAFCRFVILAETSSSSSSPSPIPLPHAFHTGRQNLAIPSRRNSTVVAGESPPPTGRASPVGTTTHIGGEGNRAGVDRRERRGAAGAAGRREEGGARGRLADGNQRVSATSTNCRFLTRRIQRSRATKDKVFLATANKIMEGIKSNAQSRTTGETKVQDNREDTIQDSATFIYHPVLQGTGVQEQGTRSKSCSANTLLQGAIFATRRLGGRGTEWEIH
ncbi:uncharacterized protein [Triticum aestivum]|uniref:uncharacterized protein n=1 Tax=Triticum aestivum TaxID=4565 RepID=UPI001D01AEA2|nr:uncharacterized protein LOC123067817 [Triticum aestivum]